MISAIVLTKNEEKLLDICLKSLSFADEIIVIDSGSTDKTLAIAEKYANRIEKVDFTNFSNLRNKGKELAKGNWLLYIDADEEIPLNLQKEIIEITADKGQKNTAGYFIERKNFYLGKEWPKKDKMVRLISKDKLLKWTGDVHESPQMENGSCGQLKNYLLHRTHNSLEEMLTNTNSWSEFEAQARFKANHPEIVWWRIPRMMVSYFWDYYYTQRGYKVGTIGLIESIYQSFSVFVTYAKLWEIQHRNKV